MAPSTHPALDPERVERLLKAAKNEPVPFAFARDPKSETGIFAADKTKTGKALLELCRKETGAKKGAYGTVSIEGVNATFLCERNELTQLPKALLGWFKAQKLSLKVSVTEGEDAAAEDEDEDEGEEQAGKVQRTPEETDEGRHPQSLAPEGSEEDAEEGEDQEEDIPEGKMFDPAVIVPLIRRAKKRPRPFAFGIGPDIDLLAVHPKADPVRLARKVREEGAKKGIWGMVQMDGAAAVFTCEKEPFSGARKGLKRWIKRQGLTLKFRLNGPEGEFVDPEDNESIESQSGESAETPPEDEFFEEGPGQQAKLRADDYNQIIADIDGELDVLRDYKTRPNELKYAPQYQAPYGKLSTYEATLTTLKTTRHAQVLLDEAAHNFGALRAHIDAALAELKTIRNDMGHTNPGFSSAKDSAETRRSIIAELVDTPGSQETDAETDTDTFEQVLNDSLAKADQIRTDLQSQLVKLWAALKAWAGNTPLSVELEAIADLTDEADALPTPGQAKRKLQLWATALVEARALWARVTPLAEARTAVRNTLHSAGHIIDQIAGSPEKTELERRSTELSDRMKTEAGTATDSADLLKRWAAVKDDAETLLTDAVALKKTSVPDPTLRADIEALVALCTELVPEETKLSKFPKFIKTVAAYTSSNIDQLVLKQGKDRAELQSKVATYLDTCWSLRAELLDEGALKKQVEDRLTSGDSLPDGVEAQAFWRAAFQKKYGVTLNIPSGMEIKKLPKLFALFDRVPTGHVGHDKLTTLDYETAAGAAFYNKQKTKINLSNVTRDLPSDMQAQFKYPLTDGSAEEYHDYFTMISLHEIGHAADGKKGLMQLEKAGMGTWKDSSKESLTTVTEIVATAIAGSTGIDKAGLLAPVKQFLISGKLDKPIGGNAPNGHLFAQWDTFRSELDKYKTMSLAGSKSPWETPVKIGDRCYHEAYPGRWMSYLEAERDDRIVSSYQWRAPGEWFAELYAWYWFANDDKERAERAKRLPAAARDAIVGTTV